MTEDMKALRIAAEEAKARWKAERTDVAWRASCEASGRYNAEFGRQFDAAVRSRGAEPMM